MSKASTALHEKTAHAVQGVGLPKHSSAVGQAASSLVHNTGAAAHRAGEIVLMPVQQVCNMTPLGSVFKSSPEDLARRKRDKEVQHAEKRLAQDEATIATLR